MQIKDTSGKVSINSPDFVRDASGSKDFSFNFLSGCFILAFATLGFGPLRIGFMYTDVTTYFIYIIFFFQLITNTLRLPKFLFIIYLYIIFHACVLNFKTISFTTPYVIHFIGFVLYSLTTASYVSVFRKRILSIIRKYYHFVLLIACIAIIQIVVFVAFRISIKPQTIFYEGEVEPFFVEIFGFLPRAWGLSKEPAHFATLLLPGVYIALLVLTGKSYPLNIKNKRIAIIILFAFILSFSIVGFFGFLLCLFAIFGNALKGRFFTKMGLIAFFIGLSFIIYSSTLMNKLRPIPMMISNIESYEFTINDLSGFALISNLYISFNALQESNFLGTGFNTHRDSYDKYIYRIFSNSQVIVESEGLNREGAGSLFIRIISEFGLPGIGLFLYFMYHYWIKRNGTSTGLRYVNNLSIIMIISYCMRNGEYLNIFLFLFLALTYYTQLMWAKSNAIQEHVENDK